MSPIESRNDLSLDESKVWWEEQVAKRGYFDGYPFSFEQPRLIARFGLKKSSYVLEIGPGMGRETHEFCKISDNVYAVDLSKSAADLVMQHAPAAHASEYDGRNLKFGPRMFDFIYSCFVIQHMSKEHAQELLRECMRVLKDEGAILFEFLDCARYYAGPNDNAYSVNQNGTRMYNNAFTRLEIESLIGKLQMNIEWIETVFIGPTMGETLDVYNHWVCIKKRPSWRGRFLRLPRRPIRSLVKLNQYMRKSLPGLHRAVRAIAPLRMLYVRLRRYT